MHTQKIFMENSVMFCRRHAKKRPCLRFVLLNNFQIILLVHLIPMGFLLENLVRRNFCTSRIKAKATSKQKNICILFNRNFEIIS